MQKLIEDIYKKIPIITRHKIKLKQVEDDDDSSIEYNGDSIIVHSTSSRFRIPHYLFNV